MTTHRLAVAALVVTLEMGVLVRAMQQAPQALAALAVAVAALMDRLPLVEVVLDCLVKGLAVLVVLLVTHLLEVEVALGVLTALTAELQIM
jgi:hypothetical protein